MAKQKPRQFEAEFKERAVRLVLEWRRARNRDDGGLVEIGGQLGVHPKTLRTLGQPSRHRRGSPAGHDDG